ncbi:hypothetical protein JTE90_028735 [Oedothorax gibbosus]|uniref:PHD-type domain-containing protein n=1 Tax=Oedothorax gibbosus TaxID=931172 RepID=A0AAV6UGM7_9ARAC|nr:hypothetical protein JTE90_028735 [Oedothorax gibbosus]
MSSNPDCTVCGEEILVQDLLLCNGVCKSNYHSLCAGFTATQFKKFPNQKKTKWICTTCTTPEAVITKTSDGHVDFAVMLNNIHSQNTELKAFMTTKFDELTSSIKQNSSVIHDLMSTIAELQNSNLALQSKQSQLENENINTNKQIMNSNKKLSN